MRQFSDYKFIPKKSIIEDDLIAVGYGKNQWVEIMSEDAVAPETGLYLVMCRGDMHLIWEFYHYQEGERLWKYYEGEYAHCDGWAGVDPVAFHFIPEYSSNNPSWRKYSPQDVTNTYGYAIIAFKKKGEDNILYTVTEVDERNKTWAEILPDYNCLIDDPVENKIIGFSFKDKDAGMIAHTFFCSFRECEVCKVIDIDIVAYYGCIFRYAEDRHGCHWELIDRKEKLQSKLH